MVTFFCDRGYCSQTKSKSSCWLVVRAVVSYSIGNADCSFAEEEPYAHPRLKSIWLQWRCHVIHSFGAVHEPLFVCSLSPFGSVPSITLTEPFFGEQWPPCRNRRHRARSLVCSGCGTAPSETIGETVMLVCPSLAVQVSALTCLLVQPLDSVHSHLCPK